MKKILLMSAMIVVGGMACVQAETIIVKDGVRYQSYNIPLIKQSDGEVLEITDRKRRVNDPQVSTVIADGIQYAVYAQVERLEAGPTYAIKIGN